MVRTDGSRTTRTPITTQRSIGVRRQLQVAVGVWLKFLQVHSTETLIQCIKALIPCGNIEEWILIRYRTHHSGGDRGHTHSKN